MGQLAEARRGNKGKGRGKGKGGKEAESFKDKMEEACGSAEEGSDLAFKCGCFAVMKVKREDRTEEQKATAKACMDKLAWAEENCKMKKGGKRRKNKKNKDESKSKGGKKKRRRKNKGKKEAESSE